MKGQYKPRRKRFCFCGDASADHIADFRRDYFEWHIHFHLGEDEKRAIAKFGELLRKHHLSPVFEPKFVL